MPERYLDQMLEYMGITRERFWEVIDRGRSPHLWERDGNEWKLRHAAWMGQHT